MDRHMVHIRSHDLFRASLIRPVIKVDIPTLIYKCLVSSFLLGQIFPTVKTHNLTYSKHQNNTVSTAKLFSHDQNLNTLSCGRLEESSMLTMICKIKEKMHGTSPINDLSCSALPPLTIPFNMERRTLRVTGLPCRSSDRASQSFFSHWQTLLPVW